MLQPVVFLIALQAVGEITAPGGGASREEEHPGFRARVLPDGTITFSDRSFDLAVVLPWDCVRSDGGYVEIDRRVAPSACLLRWILAWYEDPYHFRPPGAGPLLALAFILAGTPLFVAHFDVTDALLRWLGQEPYERAKHALVEQTRESRLAMADSDRALRQVAALNDLARRLRARWADPAPARQRRRALFELWDECLEDEPAGVQARALILGFVRDHLPPDSRDAFTRSEIAELNRARQSRAPFDPAPH
jgi:hypothetical protein